MPESGVWVLVSFPRLFDYEGELSVGINMYSDIRGWELKTTDAYVQGITHWMQLPKAPKE